MERLAEPLQATAGGARVGGQPPDWRGQHDLEGWMRDFRIYHRALRRTEIHRLAGVEAKVDLATRSPAPSPSRQATELQSGTINDNASSSQFLNERPFLQIHGNHLTVSGPPVQIYELQATFDLAKGFRPLTTLTNATGSAYYVDPEVALEESRFYRVKVLSYEPLR